MNMSPMKVKSSPATNAVWKCSFANPYSFDIGSHSTRDMTEGNWKEARSVNRKEIVE